MSKYAAYINIDSKLPAWLQFEGKVDVVSSVNLGNDIPDVVTVHKSGLTMDEMKSYVLTSFHRLYKELNEKYPEEVYPFAFDPQIMVIEHTFKPIDVYLGIGCYFQNIKEHNSLKDLSRFNDCKELYN